MDYKNLKQDDYLGAEFEKFKETEEYKNYNEMIRNDKPELSPYLVEMCLFGYFYEELRNDMEDEQLQKYPSLFVVAEKEPYIKPEPTPEYKGVSVYESEAQYLEENPHVKPIQLDMDRSKAKTSNEVIENINIGELKL